MQCSQLRASQDGGASPSVSREEHGPDRVLPVVIGRYAATSRSLLPPAHASSPAEPGTCARSQGARAVADSQRVRRSRATPSEGPRLARLRKLKGCTQQALAEAIGISQKQVTDFETGRIHINEDMIIRFALASKDIDPTEETPNIRFTKRLRDPEQLPESKKRAVIKILDEFTRPEA